MYDTLSYSSYTHDMPRLGSLHPWRGPLEPVATPDGEPFGETFRIAVPSMSGEKFMVPGLVNIQKAIENGH